MNIHFWRSIFLYVTHRVYRIIKFTYLSGALILRCFEEVNLLRFIGTAMVYRDVHQIAYLFNENTRQIYIKKIGLAKYISGPAQLMALWPKTLSHEENALFHFCNKLIAKRKFSLYGQTDGCRAYALELDKA